MTATGPASTARFVVLEGGDATGKSTQVSRLATRLRDEQVRFAKDR